VRKRTETKDLEIVLALENHEIRFARIKRMLTVFAQNPETLTRRSFLALRDALTFLSNPDNDTGVGARFMAEERADAATCRSRLMSIFRAKLAGRKIEPEPEEISETPKPAGLSPNDPWREYLP
jgi:hypothetical protein